MPRWLKWYPKKQVLVLNGDDLVQKPVKLFRDVENFLCLPYVVEKSTFYKPSGEDFNCWRWLRGKMCMRSPSKGRTHTESTDSIKKLIEMLKNYFQPWNEIFFRQIGNRFIWEMNKI